MKFEFFKRKSAAKESAKSEKILPSDVRYALRYKDGLLNREDIEILARSNFINEAVYLTFKSLVANPEKHKELLEKYVHCILNENNLIDKNDILKELIIETLKKGGGISVKGNKLAQVSRQGFDLWQEKYEASAKKLSVDQRDVYLLAHSTFIGLRSFLREFAKSGKDLNILIPEWQEINEFGYVVNFKNGQVKVDWLHKPLDNTKESVLFDDTKNTGNTAQKSQKFLTQNGSKKPEIIVIDEAY